ncbi:MAG: Holliday junction resolvase RuvX [Candidatus Doudnabacteria bacterium]
MGQKVLAIDYGTKRIGLAISDETQTLARELNILNPSEFWKKIADLITEYEIELIVLGWPVGMKGQITNKTKEVSQFADQLQELIDCPIKFLDERLTSKLAAEIAGTEHQIDSLSAQILLQNYLDNKKV